MREESSNCLKDLYSKLNLSVPLFLRAWLLIKDNTSNLKMNDSVLPGLMSVLLRYCKEFYDLDSSELCLCCISLFSL